jgi:hypothetical protein
VAEHAPSAGIRRSEAILLSFKDFYGLGDEAGGAEGYQNFTFRPWTKIA